MKTRLVWHTAEIKRTCATVAAYLALGAAVAVAAHVVVTAIAALGAMLA